MTHILVIEDSVVDFEILNRALLQSFPNSTIEHDVYGVDALDKLLQGKITPDLIISDQNLPQTTGVDLCRAVRNAKIETPIIIMTGGGSEEVAVEALKNGASDYVVKDVSGSWTELVTMIIPTVLKNFEDSVARKTAEEQLRQTAESLRLRNAELDAFARTVAHDLKSPMAQIIGFAELLRDAPAELLEHKGGTWLSNILRIAGKSASTIQALLDLARYTDDDAEIQPFDMRFVFESALPNLRNDIEEKQALIRLPAEWPMVLGNPNWVQDTWFNLLSVAIQSGGLPPEINVSWEKDGPKEVRFCIKHNGVPLSEADQMSFFMISSHGPVSGLGLKLGLSMSKQVTKKQGGEIGVESDGENGAMIWFSLPMAEPLLSR